MNDFTDPYERHNPTRQPGAGCRASIVAECGPERGKIWHIDKPVFVIGAADDCDLIFNNGQLATYHAYIFVRDHVVTLRHLGPPPVVIVNGRMMRWGELQNEDRIMLGNREFRVQLATVDSAQHHDLPWSLPTVAGIDVSKSARLPFPI